MKSAIVFFLILFIVAIVLDILFVRGMQKYRRLKKEATDADGNLKSSKFELLERAFLGERSTSNDSDSSQREMVNHQPKTKGNFFVTTRNSFSVSLFVEGLVILFFGTNIYRSLPPEDHYKIFWSFAVGMIFIILGLTSLRSDGIYKRVVGWLQRMAVWLCISPLQVVLLFTSPVFTVLAINAAGLEAKMWSPFVAIVTWLLGIGLAVLGAWNWAEIFPRVTSRTILWCAVVTLLAFLVRGIATPTIPILLTGDEASMGIDAVRYAHGDWNNIFITGWFSFPTLYYFIQSLGIRIFENPIEALRIPSALAGALTVGTVYLCGKMMFGHRTGLFASLILASLHLHIHFSRLGLNNIWDGLWFTITVAMLWYGWKYQARWAYLLAGLSLGFSQYFYASSKALVGVIVIAACLALIFQRARFRQALPDLCAKFLVSLAIFLPLSWYYANDLDALAAPFARASMLKEIGSSGPSFWKFLSQSLPNSLGAYIHTPFMQLSFWYPSETPILLPVAAIFFSIGLAFLFFRQKDSRSVLLVLWLFLIALGNALSSPAPVAQRYIAAAPVCALAVGFGLHKTTEIFATRLSRLQRIFSVIAYIILVCIVVSDLWFYFVDYTEGSISREITSNGMVAHQFGTYLKDQPANTQVVFFGLPRLSSDSPAIVYFAPQVKGVNASKEWDSFDQSQLTSSKIIFVFLPEYRQDMEPVQKDYPGGKLTVEQGWNGDVLYWVYEKDQ